ncbi:probable sucrose-phosphate synthase 1 [Olea europaea subsp. europaea]|uniref:Sucrose-phosphate synthase n=1 Tax=Olea europaea subsp. europaea TaxID=158383 RepID=A0A8S0VEJ1_OLEEU|nr:probable sucrose-phosphate synthase 1 [Olea europaea subsp. europaea]
MAGNDWINSYLEAILDVDAGINDQKSSLLLRERGRFSPAQYFVEEVITGFDETDLHRSWVRASAIRNSEERNTRLENMCWRIWNLAREKKRIEGEEAQRKTKRHIERERARREATADMSEDLSEGEKGDTAGDLGRVDSIRGRMQRVSSVDMMENWASQNDEKKLYLVLISLHGLIRGENMELGRDSDTGGQVKYVVELARALGAMPGVYRVDLLTRQVSAPDVDFTYSEPIEMLNPFDTDNPKNEIGESGGAYIIRIPFGPKDKYISKELLWPHIPEFVDGALSHIVQISEVLGKQVGSRDPLWPVAIHGHYADAGNSAALLSGVLNVPMIFTGHSLGQDKLEQLLKQGRQSREEINATYKIMRRIEAEEISLDVSEVIITSTRQEIEEQWRLCDGFDPVLERKLRARIKRNVNCYGRSMPRMVVIPPGVEFHHIIPHDGDIDGEVGNEDSSGSPDPPIWSEIMRFFSNPRKPMILALARPDPKKNLITLVKAFGECRQLRELANLTLIMGNRDAIDEMSTTNSSVLLSILKLIDKYDLYGLVAYPKHHKQSDVPEIYRLAAKTKGVFINPAFIEPFGLTLVEAAAYGLPIVATTNGGPVDIHRVLDNGLLVDPHNQQSIADALLKLVADKQLWAKCREHGLKNIHLFSWPEHCKAYLARVTSCKQRQPKWLRNNDVDTDSESDGPGESLRDIHDLSLNLNISLDSDINEGIESSNNASTCRENAIDGKNQVNGTSLTLSLDESMDKAESSKFSASRNKVIHVIAVDCDSTADILNITKTIIEAGRMDGNADSVSFILSTASTLLEINSLLNTGGLKPSDFFAFICNSGGEIYYPSPDSGENSSGSPYIIDSVYHSHMEYRWGKESLRNMLVRWATSINDKMKGKDGPVLSEDNSGSSHCYAFKVKNPALLPPFKELRQLMRIQALRCHAAYCQNGTRMNVIPILASRAQALRYLYVRWGINLSNVVVFVGECGDTDYEQLLGGTHKTVILNGLCRDSSKLHTNRSYPLEHVLPIDHPYTVECEQCSKDDIRASLGKLGFNKG